MNETYRAAREIAQGQANATGFDYGLSWNPLFSEWNVRMLPGKPYRCGSDLRCEVVSCEDYSRIQKGHGP